MPILLLLFMICSALAKKLLCAISLESTKPMVEAVLAAIAWGGSSVTVMGKFTDEVVLFAKVATIIRVVVAVIVVGVPEIVPVDVLKFNPAGKLPVRL